MKTFHNNKTGISGTYNSVPAYNYTKKTSGRNTLKCSFVGRPIGWLGIFHEINVTLLADNKESAYLQIHKYFEHITKFKVL